MALKLFHVISKKTCKVLLCSKRLYGIQRRNIGILITFIITLAITTTYFFLRDNRTILSHKDTHRLVQSRLKEFILQEKGMGCQQPEIDPFSAEAMKFNEDFPRVTCEGTDWVICNAVCPSVHLVLEKLINFKLQKSECYVTAEILKNLTDVSCTYRDIIYVDDQLYFISDYIKMSGGEKYTLRRSDHVKVSCSGRELNNSNNILSSRWYGLKAGFRPVATKPIPPDRKNSYNVMILAFDSASHKGFTRKMPKSFKYLTDRAVILNGHNIVGDGTPPALYAILSGKAEEEHPDARKKITKKVYVDHKLFIFHQLKQYGYRTAYFEDSPWVGTFQLRFNGFRRQPADHYLRALLLEKNNNMRIIDLFHKAYCLGASPQYQLLLNLTAEFLELDGKKFSFTFIADISHDNFNRISTADEAVISFLETLVARRVFEDTLVIVMGDHGSRFTKFRETYQGKLEERLPLMAIFLPEKLKQLRPNALAALKQNIDVLTTPFDIHTTILDVLDLKDKSNKYKVPGSDLPRAMSLLEPIPKTRTCADAGIVQHWCACTKWFNVSQLSPMYNQVANVLAEYIDSISEEQRSKCERRQLLSIESVLQQNVHNELLTYIYEKEEDRFLGNSRAAAPRALKEYYQAKIILGPGRGVFEGTMMYNTRGDSFTLTAKHISRISAYGDEPKCVSTTHPHLNPFCYCKDLLRKQVLESSSQKNKSNVDH